MVSRQSSLPGEGELTESQLEHWLTLVGQHRPAKEMDLLRQAVTLAKKSHEGEVTPDGMPRILALLHTADTLHELQMDTESLIAALLSELPYQEGYDESVPRQAFGDRVMSLVSQVSRIRDLSAIGSREHEASSIEALRRMLLGLADDVRTLLILLAKRLRLMRGLKHLSRDHQLLIARETSLVHAPLANRLGIWQIKWELEDLSLRFLEPEEYTSIAKKLDSRRQEREDFIASVISRLQAACEENGISPDINGRPKHIYSIWKKMHRKQVDFEQVFDVRAVRVLVDTLPQCYEVLGLAHAIWRPVPGEFDDYIARPKPNGYSSLHTAVVGDDGKPLEIQVRTRSMHEQAERGVAAHWRYKETKDTDDELDRRVEWMRRWLEQQDETSVESSFTHESDEAFESKHIYVLSPQGKVVELPRGATPVDFAYAIHTAVGHKCRGAKVNGKITTLTQPLESGQTVEVITAKEGGPSRDWLNPHSHYLATSRARNRVRQWFKHQDYEEHLHIGRASLEREITRLGVNKPDLEKIIDRFNFKTVDDLLAAIGRGDLSPIQVANLQVKPVEHDAAKEIPEKARRRSVKRPSKASSQIVVEGVEDLMTNMAKCCKPVPFDAIVGYITKGRGVTVHRKDCDVVRKMNDEQQARLISVFWADESADATFLVDVQIFAGDRKGLLRDITSVFANEEIDLLGVKTQSDKQHEKASMKFTAEVSNMTQLSRLLERLAQVPDVIDVRRQV